MKDDITRRWIVVTVEGKRICWGPAKYILSHFLQDDQIQFNKDVKVEAMTKKEVFSFHGRAVPNNRSQKESRS